MEARQGRYVFRQDHNVFRKGPKGPGDAEFEVAAEDFTDEVYEDDGLSPGVHEFIVIPHNSRGTGPASAVARVTVVIAAAA